MRCKLDENIPLEAAGILSKKGVDVKTVLQQKISGCADESLVEVCKAEGRTLVTLDLDFADVRVYPPGNYPGIVVLRTQKMSKKIIFEMLNKISAFLIKENISGKLWIVEKDRIRIRGK